MSQTARTATPAAHGGLKSGGMVALLTAGIYFYAPHLQMEEQGMVTAAVLSVTTIIGKTVREEMAKTPPTNRAVRMLMELLGGLL